MTLNEQALEKAARAGYEAVTDPKEAPAGGFTRWATWEELKACPESYARELMRARAILSTLPREEELAEIIEDHIVAKVTHCRGRSGHAVELTGVIEAARAIRQQCGAPPPQEPTP